MRGYHLAQPDKEVWSEMRIIKAWEWTKKDSLELAIYAAEKVLVYYENKYPNDKSVRLAIEAAKKVLAKDTPSNRNAAAYAAYAAYAADAAAYASFVKDIEKWMKNHLKDMKEIKQ